MKERTIELKNKIKSRYDTVKENGEKFTTKCYKMMIAVGLLVYSFTFAALYYKRINIVTEFNQLHFIDVQDIGNIAGLLGMED